MITKILRKEIETMDKTKLLEVDSNNMDYASGEITEALEMINGLVKLIDILHTEYGVASVRDLSEREKYIELTSLLPTIKASAQGIQTKIDIVFDALNDSVAYKRRLESANLMKG